MKAILKDKKESKERLDKILFEKNFFTSREKARREIMAGNVFVEGKRIDKPGTAIFNESKIEIKNKSIPYVSRGGLKLEKALEEFNIDVRDKIALDIGASTGGFTDCLLKHNCSLVYAVDVGYGQIAWELKNNPKVKVIDRVNARYLKADDFSVKFDIIVIDVSFISLTKILPSVVNLLSPKGEIIALIKPQFEAGREKVGKGGIVRDLKVHEEVIERIKEFSSLIKLTPKKVIESPILGMDGNKEFFMLLELRLRIGN